MASTALGISADKIYTMETSTTTVPNTSPTAASCGSDLNGAAVLVSILYSNTNTTDTNTINTNTINTNTTNTNTTNTNTTNTNTTYTNTINTNTTNTTTSAYTVSCAE